MFVLVAVASTLYARYHSPEPARKLQLVVWYGVAMAVSPLLFAFLPRSLFDRPALLLLTWWIVPLTTLWIGFRRVTEDQSPTSGLFLVLASFMAMFLPVVVGGIIRSRNRPKI